MFGWFSAQSLTQCLGYCRSSLNICWLIRRFVGKDTNFNYDKVRAISQCRHPVRRCLYELETEERALVCLINEFLNVLHSDFLINIICILDLSVFTYTAQAHFTLCQINFFCYLSCVFSFLMKSVHSLQHTKYILSFHFQTLLCFSSSS